MASPVGALVVELIASTARFQQDLGKAVAAAEKGAANIVSAFKGIAGALAGGIGFQVILDSVKDTIHAAAALDDLADATGSTVENLSKLANQAAISGTSFDTLQGLVLKLSAGMAGADDEASNVGRALKFLGVSAKDPAEALQQVAVAMSKYADGIGKAALARDLFGKGGPAFLATLKDIAELQNVNATVTAKQAKESEELEKAWRSLGNQATTLRNAILSGLVPALNDLVSQFSLARNAGLGFWASLQAAGLDASQNLEPIISSLNKNIAKTNADIQRFEKTGGVSAESLIARAKIQLAEYEAKLKTVSAIRDRALLADPKLRGQEDRGFDPRKPAGYTGTADKDARAGRAAKERISDAERYIEQLEQQLQKTQELTVVETILADIESARFKVTDAGQVARALAIGGQIDAAKQQAKIAQEQEKLRSEEARTREQTSRLTQNAVKAAQDETESLAQQNAHIREEIELIGKDATSIERIMQARLDDAIAAKTQALAASINAGASKGESDAIEDQIRLLQQRKGLLVQRGVAEKLAEEAARAKEINDIFVNSFADGVTSIVTGTKSIGDAFKDMERQIVASISRIASQNIANAIFGGATSSGGGGILSGIGPFLSSLLGGGGGSNFQFGKAVGGPVSANQPYIVGERGPELFVPKQSGNIVPNNVLASRRDQKQNNISISVNVMPGASRTTADQAALQTGAAVQRALNRNG